MSGRDVRSASNPQQIQLCMVGDSITWAEYGDYWRKYMLEHLPRLAFVGNHTGLLGYSHEGEGGNNTTMVLERISRIPACHYYHLHIGTNDNSLSGDEWTGERLEKHIAEVAARIFRIVELLLLKPAAQKVFLGTIMPCHTDNPRRDAVNSCVNAILRIAFRTKFPEGRVVLIDYENAIRPDPGWEPLMRLHPTRQGYKMVAAITVEAIIEALGINDPQTVPVPRPGSGVKLINLWDQQNGRTRDKIIAGWYTFSFDAEQCSPVPPRIRLCGDSTQVKFHFDQNFYPLLYHDRWYFNFFTGYEGYEYNMNILQAESSGGPLQRILLEKNRPAARPSVFGEGTYADRDDHFVIGEELIL